LGLISLGNGDGIGSRVSEACLDFGLERIQFSVFCGKLNRNKRQELLMKLTETLGDEPGKILIQPMCEDVTFRFPMTAELLSEARAALSAMQDSIGREIFPDPTPVRARCPDCEYRNFCGDVF
jgi:CRISPR-associated endonuclease Cas2